MGSYERPIKADIEFDFARNKLAVAVTEAEWRGIFWLDESQQFFVKEAAYEVPGMNERRYRAVVAAFQRMNDARMMECASDG